MKANIRNRKTVALAITKSKLSGHNPDKHFAKEVGSRMLYHNSEKLTVTAKNRKNPDSSFVRTHLGGDIYVWKPANKAAEEYLRSLPEEEFHAFIHHSRPPAVDKPESRRVVVGNPIKGLPKGHREGDYYSEDGSFSTPRERKAARTKETRMTSSRTHVHVTADEPEEQEIPPTPSNYLDAIRNAASLSN